MITDPRDLDLLSALSDGLPLTAAPYAALGESIGMNEAEVMARLKALRESGIIKRFGVIVRHHELGFRANAMCVWDVPDESVEAVGRQMANYRWVTLCYQRPRRLPRWPYNLFCMIHGRDRGVVEGQAARISHELGLGDRRHAVLFSRRRFKQRGARYDLVKGAA